MLKYLHLIAQHQPDIKRKRDRLATANVRDYPDLTFDAETIDEFRSDMLRDIEAMGARQKAETKQEPQIRLVVRRSSQTNGGGGLFAVSFIPKGSYVVEYKGCLLKANDFEYDYDRSYILQAGSRYIDARDPAGRLRMADGQLVNVHQFRQKDWEALDQDGVDWVGEASLARFINEARGKESGKRNVRFGTDPKGKRKMGYIATCDVQEGEELLTTCMLPPPLHA
jgi:hypothetical protein